MDSKVLFKPFERLFPFPNENTRKFKERLLGRLKINQSRYPSPWASKKTIIDKLS